MDEKSLELFEFYEIKKKLAGYMSFSAGSELVLELRPFSDYDKVSLCLKQSAAAKRHSTRSTIVRDTRHPGKCFGITYIDNS